MTGLLRSGGDLPLDRRVLARRMTVVLVLVLGILAVASAAIGATGTSLWGALADLAAGRELATSERVILFDIRLPRTLMCMTVGAALAVAGAILQGLFRNPLADPGIVGVSAGASLGAITAIVLGGLLPATVLAWAGPSLVALSAFLGAWLLTLLLYRVSTRNGQTSVATMLLAGVAFTALAMALSGVLVFMANDSQLRDLTFWNMGSLAGATWGKLQVTGPVILLALGAAMLLARGLNALAMGEAVAAHLGIPVQRTKGAAILCTAVLTGTAVAVSGGIGFIGIIVPHLLRLATGPDHHGLLPNCALFGAALLLFADIIARVIVSPAELPIGIVTALMGTPVFLWILLRRHAAMGL